MKRRRIGAMTGYALVIASACLIGGCTGGDGSPAPGGGGTPGTSSQYAQKCAPANAYARDGAGRLLTGYADGTLPIEKSWLAAYMNEAYLWYREIPQVDPASPAYSDTAAHFASMDNYFEALKTQVVTTTGAKKDRFSFVYPTADYTRLFEQGVVYGYGVQWQFASETVPRNIRVAYVETGSSGAQAGITRGDRLVAATIDAVTVPVDTTTQVDRLNQALSPSQNGTAIQLDLAGANGVTRRVAVVSGQVTNRPVFLEQVIAAGSDRVGYLMINDFIAPAESQMVDAMQRFRDQSITELIVDLRYNGGGYVYLASQLAYMVAGASRSASKVFESYRFNDKRSSENSSIGFLGTSTGFAGSGTTAGRALPQLNLARVIVLTTDDTCSASESFVNGLRGIGVTATLVGGRTCGKPYGFTAKDNCGISYFPIEFQGVNANGFGEFADGLDVSCAAADDLDRPLGDRNEGLLAAALGFRVSGVCAAVAAGKADDGGAPAAGPHLYRSPVREGKILKSVAPQ